MGQDAGALVGHAVLEHVGRYTPFIQGTRYLPALVVARGAPVAAARTNDHRLSVGFFRLVGGQGGDRGLHRELHAPVVDLGFFAVLRNFGVGDVGVKRQFLHFLGKHSS